MTTPARRTKAGGAKKRPTRYAGLETATSHALAVALRAHRKGAFDAARTSYREVLDHHPESLDAWMNLGALAVVTGRAREAAAAFTRSLAIAPADPRVSRDAGIGLAAIGRFEAARLAFETALALDGSLLGARLALARVCADMGDPAAAVDHARRAVVDAPGDASAHLELHRALFDDHAMRACIDAAQRAVALDPGYALARFFLSGALALEGRHDEAEAVLEGEPPVSDGLRHILAYATRPRDTRPRYFASARDTLHFAISQAKSTGRVLEFGVRHGVSTRTLARRVETTVDAFDVFTGLPEQWQGKAPGAFSTAGEVPDVPANVRLHIGLFDDTLPPFVSELREPPRLVHIDSDLYSSARSVLQALGPHIRPGCVIVFDEYIGNASWRDDEFRAFHEAVAHFGWEYDELALSWITGQAVIRIRSAVWE